MARLGDICKKASSSVAQKDLEEREGQYPIYGASGLIKYVDFYHQEKPYVAVVKDGAGVGRVMQLPAKSSVIGTMQYIIPDDGVNVSYLAYALEHMNLSKYYTGATIPHIYFKDYCNETMPDHGKEEQKYIAEILDKVNSLVTLRKQQLIKLDELVKARFVEMFGNLHSTNFPKCKMRDVCGIKHGYAFSGEFFTEEDNNILLVTPGNFKVGGGFQEKKCKFFTGEYSKEYVLNGGDLIVTMTDLSKNMDTLGYSAIVPCTDRVYLHNQRIGLFVDLSEKINRVFLMYFMQTTEYRDSIIASATGSTVHHTSPSKILDCDVFVPPIELQEQFAAFVEQTDKSILAIQESLTKLETLKKALMQRFFG